MVTVVVEWHMAGSLTMEEQNTMLNCTSYPMQSCNVRECILMHFRMTTPRRMTSPKKMASPKRSFENQRKQSERANEKIENKFLDIGFLVSVPGGATEMDPHHVKARGAAEVESNDLPS